MTNLEAALLREVAVVQNTKTLQAVRDLAESIATKERTRSSYSESDRSANSYKWDLLNGLKQLREAGEA